MSRTGFAESPGRFFHPPYRREARGGHAPDGTTRLGEGDFIAFSADRPHTYDVVDGPVRGVMLMTYPEVPAPIWTAGGADLPPATSGR